MHATGGQSTHSCVHWLRTKRNVIDDFPHPPSPHTVMEILCGSFMLLPFSQFLTQSLLLFHSSPSEVDGSLGGVARQSPSGLLPEECADQRRKCRYAEGVVVVSSRRGACYRKVSRDPGPMSHSVAAIRF